MARWSALLALGFLIKVAVAVSESGLKSMFCGMYKQTQPVTPLPFTPQRRFGEKLEHVYVLGPVRRLSRELRARTSSRLEQCILKATRPNDEAVKQKHLDRILASVEQFDTIREHYKCEPSKVLVSKLRKRLRENNWRTVVKGLYVVHRLLQHSPPGGGDEHDKIAAEFRRTGTDIATDPFREDVEGSDSVRKLKLFVQHYHAYLHFRASDASDDISRLLLPPPLPLSPPPTEAPEGSTKETATPTQAAEKEAGEESLSSEEGDAAAPEAPLSPVASAIPPASGTPVRRRLASATAALNRLMTLALDCNGFLGEIADHPVIRPCLACVAEDVATRCEVFYCGHFLQPGDLQGDVIEELLQAEAVRFRELLPRLLPFVQAYGSCDSCTHVMNSEGRPPQWMDKLLPPLPPPQDEEATTEEVEGKEEGDATQQSLFVRPLHKIASEPSGDETSAEPQCEAAGSAVVQQVEEASSESTLQVEAESKGGTVASNAVEADPTGQEEDPSVVAPPPQEQLDE